MKRIFAAVLGTLGALWPVLTFAQEALPEGPEAPPPPSSSSLLDGMMLMSNEALIMLVAGVVLSLVFAIVERQTWPSDFKALAFFAVCTLFGVIYSLAVDDDITAGDIGRRILIVLATGTVFYLMFKGPVKALESRSDSWFSRGPQG